MSCQGPPWWTLPGCTELPRKGLDPIPSKGRGGGRFPNRGGGGGADLYPNLEADCGDGRGRCGGLLKLLLLNNGGQGGGRWIACAGLWMAGGLCCTGKVC